MEPTGDPRAALRRLRERPGVLDDLADRFDIVLLVVFGSTLGDGDAADLDLGVFTDRPLDALSFMEALYQATGFEHFDVVDLGRAGVVARLEALREGETLIEARAGEHHERLVQAATQAMDTQWLRDLELDALAK